MCSCECRCEDEQSVNVDVKMSRDIGENVDVQRRRCENVDET